MSVLELQGVGKTYGHGHTAVHALRDVTLTLRAGELAVIMGPSGSGKSTLLMIAGMVLTPSAGSVTINGIPTADRAPSDLARLRLRQIGFVFQSFNLFASLTARENVALPASLAGTPAAARRTLAAGLLERFDLGSRADHLPEELSVGEKQRVALARALINRPPLLLADEPTANLDSESGLQVVAMLREITVSEGRTALVVTHDERIAATGDRLFRLEDGRLRAA
jgi:putative ABC transport system ATP-binding protein